MVVDFVSASMLLNFLSGILVVSQFVIGTAVILLTEPVTLGSAVSMYSKLLQPEVQGKVYYSQNQLI